MTEEPTRRSPRLALALLSLLTIAALAARLCGIGTFLPHRSDPDSVIVTQAAWLDRPAGVESGTAEAIASEFYPRLLAFALWLAPGRSYARTLPPEAPLEAHLAAASEPFLRGRILIALLSVLAIPGTFLLARRFLDSWTALLAAAFAGTSLILQFYGSQARPHAASTSLSLLAVLAILRLRGLASLPAYASAALLSAIAVGCLWNGVFVVPAFAMAFGFAARRRATGLLLVLALLGASVAVFYDFVFRTSGVQSGVMKLGGQKLPLDAFDGSGFLRIAQGFWSFDPVLLAAGGLGLAFLAIQLLRRPRPEGNVLKDLAVAAAFPVAFVLFWGATSRVPPRFSLPLLPYLSILAAFGVARMIPRRWPARLRVSVALAALALPAFACAKLTRLHVEPDTLSLAARWISSRVEREREVVATPYLADLPLLRARADLAAVATAVQSPWQRYQSRLPSDARLPAWRLPTMFEKAALADARFDASEVRAWLERERPDYVVVSSGWSSGRDWDSTPDVLAEEGAELVLSLSGGREEAKDLADVGFERGERALAKILAMTRPGPWIEIYRRRLSPETR